MPETAWTTAPTTSPSSATWPSISSARSPPKAPCASRSSGQDGRTRSSPKSSPKSEMRLPWEWCYLYRAIDRDGNLVDVYLSETRDMAAAKAFLRSARSVTQVEPEQVTTDGHTSYPKAIAEELGTDVD